MTESYLLIMTMKLMLEKFAAGIDKMFYLHAKESTACPDCGGKFVAGTSCKSCVGTGMRFMHSTADAELKMVWEKFMDEIAMNCTVEKIDLPPSKKGGE
jgi:DnaJ-class molecular chaperone